MTILNTRPQSTPLYAGTRIPAFEGIAHQSGAVVSESGMSVNEAVDIAGLGFTVSTHPVHSSVASNGGAAIVNMPQHRATIRRDVDGSRSGLGIVKGRYTPIQNRDAFAFGQHLVDEFDANVHAAAAYGKPEGVRTFLTLRLRDEIDIAGDPHDMYVLIRNSHDGSTGLTAAIVPIRIASMSEVTVDTGRAPQQWTLRHSGNIEEKFAEAVHTMEMVRNWISTYTTMTYELLASPMGREKFTAFATWLLRTPRNAGPRAAENWAERRRTLTDLFEHADTCSFGRGTRYAAFCAVNEYVDHFAAARGGDAAATRHARNLNGQAGRFKARAWRLLTSM